jgi:hypothetical protein
MLPILLNKILQLKTDPVLRRWLVGRLLGHWPGEPAFTAHRPPYLEGLLPLSKETPSADFPELVHTAPTKSINISLAGEAVTLAPGDEEALFKRSFKGLEPTLALHRFAWLMAGHGTPTQLRSGQSIFWFLPNTQACLAPSTIV